MGHITIHQSGVTLPFANQCIVCKSSANSPERSFFVDTGVETEWDGAVIFCEDCLKNLIKKSFGYDPFLALQAQEAESKSELDKFREENEAYHSLLLALEKVHIQPTTIFEMAQTEDKISGLRSRNSTDEGSSVRISLGTQAEGSEPTESDSDGVVIHSEFGLNDSTDVESDGVASVVDIATGEKWEPVSNDGNGEFRLHL